MILTKTTVGQTHKTDLLDNRHSLWKKKIALCVFSLLLLSPATIVCAHKSDQHSTHYILRNKLCQQGAIYYYILIQQPISANINIPFLFHSSISEKR